MYPCFVRAGHFERDLEVDWRLLLEECREFARAVDSVDFVSVGGSSVVVFAAETVATAGSSVATVVIVAVV